MDKPPIGWTFAIDEFANSGWRCVGERHSGHVVSRDGSDPEAVQRECWAAARWVDSELERATVTRDIEPR